MRIITLDFETRFGDDYSLSKMTTEAYVRDPRFKAHGAAVKWSDSTSAVWYDEKELRRHLKEEDWSDVFLLCHHINFDGFILSQHYNVVPAMYGCTLSCARMMLGNHLSVSLDAVRKHYGMHSKTTPYSSFKNKVWEELTPQVQQMLAEGACDEVESIYALFKMFIRDGFPREELDVIDSVARMFCTPILVGDGAMFAKVWETEATKKQNRLDALGIQASELQSSDRFAELLRQQGVEPETKTSPKGNEIYAFAKNDQFMRDLCEDEDDTVRALAEARLGAKSTLLQTRAETLGWMASRGPMPVYLRYSGAATLRFSGGDGANWQNFKRGSDIRRAICAPEGYLLAPIDLSQVECRVLGYLAKQEDQLQNFREGGDPYIGIASKFYGREITKKDASERGTGKQAILSCGYGSAGPKFQATAKLGIYGPPVHLELHEANKFVELYRSTHSNVVQYWKDAEMTLKRMANWLSFDWGPMQVRCDVDKGTRRVYFPNGTCIIYDTLCWRAPSEEDADKGRRPGWYIKTRYGWKSIYGSMLAQHMCEAVSRLIMTQAMLRIKNDLKLRPVNSTHDELLVLILKDGNQDRNLQLCIDEMTREPSWLPGLPLDAEGALGERYEK